MTRAMLIGLAAVGPMLICLGCSGNGPGRRISGKPWLDAEGEWTARADEDQVQAHVKLDQAGLFGNTLELSRDQARAGVGPLAARMYDGQPLQLGKARMSRPLSGQRHSLELFQAASDKRQVRTRIVPGEVTVIEVAGGDALARLSLPVRIDGVELLAMDYGWILKDPGRFSRDRVMTDFILAEGRTQAVLLGADQSWRFEVEPDGRIAATATHRAATVRFFVGVAGKGSWGPLVAAYRQAAHPDWGVPGDPVRERRLATLVGRMVLDDWSDLPFDQVVPVLERLRFLDCQNLVVVRHNWQHYGYDVKLPDTWPPREAFGGAAGLRRLADYCRSGGIPFGLHENFIDLYRDAPTFDEWAVAFKPREFGTDGRLQEYKGWYNPETKQQAVRHTPGSALRAMQRNVEREQQVQPSTIFIDVTSYVDPEALQTSAGVYVGTEKVLEAGRDLYTRAADAVRGPALGEGCTEKFLGAVQGANCDLWNIDRWGNKAAPADWEYFPLLDWLAHDRVVFQGVGYPARYGAAAQIEFTQSLYERPFLDDYNSTNVLFGHAPLYFMISAGYSADPLRMAGMYWLSVPLSEDLGLQRIEEVSFEGGDIHRQAVRYAGGKQVWVNRSDKPWAVEGVVLPKYGYLARGSQVEQRLALEAGRPLEVMRTGGILYVDFRGSRRGYDGVEADGAVLVGPAAGGVEVIPLAGNTGPVHVDAGKLLGGAAAGAIRAELVWVDGSRSTLAVKGTTVEVPPQPQVSVNKLGDVYRRPLLKAVLKTAE